MMNNGFQQVYSFLFVFLKLMFIHQHKKKHCLKSFFKIPFHAKNN